MKKRKKKKKKKKKGERLSWLTGWRPGYKEKFYMAVTIVFFFVLHIWKQFLSDIEEVNLNSY